MHRVSEMPAWIISRAVTDRDAAYYPVVKDDNHVRHSLYDPIEDMEGSLTNALASIKAACFE